MSNAVFPTFPGVAWSRFRTSEFATIRKTTDSGREFVRAQYSSPRYAYKLNFEVLRAGALAELETLQGFFCQMRGDYDTWLFNDPDDNTATAQQFGTGNGTTTQFQLLRALGGFYDPVYDLNGAPNIYINDWQGQSLCSSSARTNRLIYSEQFQQAAWNKGGTGVTADYGASPTGASNSADRLYEGSGTSYHYINQEGAGLFDATLPTTVSMYVKPNGRTSINLYMFDGPTTSYVRASFDITAGTVTGTQAAGPASSYLASSCTKFSNGWCYITLTGIPGSNTSPSTKQVQIRMLDGGGAESYTGDGTSGILVWGAQVEQSDIPGRYIGTTGSQASFTDYAQGSNGLITFSAAPAAGAVVKWSGQYYWRCRFTKSVMELEQFMSKLWAAKSVEFKTVKP